ncbi:hypothetical protein AB0I10_17835 [Streptomyces sp. NPDC050636]|uniref:hypothetical protein n=1 Tax=Streptomyces sp. NPDC050636 TaxID=3154510 RepID=UPI00342DF2C6
MRIRTIAAASALTVAALLGIAGMAAPASADSGKDQEIFWPGNGIFWPGDAVFWPATDKTGDVK